MKIKLLLSLSIIGLTINLFAQSKTQSVNSLNVKRLKCSPDYSIDFVKFGQRESIYSGETDDRVWLKFTNKSKKTLQINATDDSETYKFMKGISKELNLYYEVINKKKCDSDDKAIEELPIGYTRREVYISFKLKPKESFIFSVAQQYFLPDRAIYINYECVKNCTKNEKDKLQKAHFFASQLPETND